MSKAKRKSVVVVGGGAAGAAIARILSVKLNPDIVLLTLVTVRPFVLHLPAAIRMTTTSEVKLEDDVLILYDNLLVNNNGTIKIGRVTSIDRNKESRSGHGSVLLSTNERIRYDILVLVPGSEWEAPLPSLMIALLSLRTSSPGVASSKTPAGSSSLAAALSEYAGKIKDAFPRKLLNMAYPSKYRRRVEKDLASRGINFVFNDYVDDFRSLPAVTCFRRPLEGDLVVPTFGSRPGTGFVRSPGSNVLNSRGQIKIRPTFQLESHSNIYAIGDVTNLAEQKQATKAPKHAQIAATNIVSQLCGGVPKKTYSGQPELVIITNGKKQGISFMSMLWGITLGNWFSSSMKGKELMVSMARKSYGLSK
ncbi:hypothetical protein BJV78DRAFT_1281245 [Lactifluus subvellereus]|nr:hypothetical protein BJV78DRAFT_1281245 [Lactifluus subvellereus]